MAGDFRMIAVSSRQGWGKRSAAFNRGLLAITICLRTVVCGLIALLTSISPASAAIDVVTIAGEPLAISG
jgi:hypothetical protein